MVVPDSHVECYDYGTRINIITGLGLFQEAKKSTRMAIPVPHHNIT